MGGGISAHYINYRKEIMTNLTAGEQALYSKYYGDRNLVANNEFWDDVLIHLKDKAIILPMQFDYEHIRTLQEMLNCEPGVCGECCRYDKVFLTEQDINRMQKAGAKPEIKTEGSDPRGFMSCNGGCAYLKENKCSIYNDRPSVCTTFPVVDQPVQATIGNTPINVIAYVVKCKPAVQVIKMILTGHCLRNNLILLPDLNTVKNTENEGALAAAIAKAMGANNA
jgi:Fe-S-cluster containining protein